MMIVTSSYHQCHRSSSSAIESANKTTEIVTKENGIMMRKIVYCFFTPARIGDMIMLTVKREYVLLKGSQNELFGLPSKLMRSIAIGIESDLKYQIA